MTDRAQANENFIALWKTGFVKPAATWEPGSGIPYSEEAAKTYLVDVVWSCGKIELSDETGSHVTCVCVVDKLRPEECSWNMVHAAVSEFLKAGPDAANRTLAYLEKVFPDECAEIKNKSVFENTLLELGFKKKADPHEGSNIICWPSPDGRTLPDAKQIAKKSFVKNRVELLGCPIIVAIAEKGIMVQICQVAGEAGSQDPRVKDGGLVWFVEVFESECDALEYIKRATAENAWYGLIYGPLFPAP